MTRRERLEKKLEKRRDWAEGRDKKADAAHDRVHQIADGIPFGQPILVGHHSERHARRDQERMHSGMSAAVENSKMAAHHRQAADGIERALATSVFSDDEDAIERLTEIVVELEAKRDRMKRYNALRRKRKSDTEGFAEDFAAAGVTDAEARSLLETIRVVPYQSKHGAFPAYELSNLGATIRQKRQRVEQIAADREAASSGIRRGGRVMLARFGGECADCGEAIEKGTPMTWYRTTREAVHVNCPIEVAEVAPPHPSRVTASGPGHVTGVQPMCPTCPKVAGHEDACLTQADVEGLYVLDPAAENGYRVAGPKPVGAPAN